MAGAIAKHLMGMRMKGMLSKRSMPSLRVHATVESPMHDGPMAIDDTKYDRKEAKRLKAEIAAHQHMLDNWDPESVADQAHKSLKADHAVKKARLAEIHARIKAANASKMAIGGKKKKPKFESEPDELAPDDETEEEGF